MVKSKILGLRTTIYKVSDLMTATVKDPWGNVIGLIYNPHFQLKD